MLKKFHLKKDPGKTSSTAHPSDTCFCCHKLGHWAAECPEGHEVEWLAKQKCFFCGQQGHIQSARPKKSEKQQLKSKIIQNRPPAVKHTWYSASTSLTKLLSTLTPKPLDDFTCYKQLSTSPCSDGDPKCFKQRSVQWFNSHKGKINGSKT